MKKFFKQDIQSLTQIFEFTRVFKNKNRLDPATTFTIEIILEEIFSNIIKYNQGENSKVLIELQLDNESILIKIIYKCSQPFDLSKAGYYDTTAPLNQRPIGKLGLHLVKNLADQISYQYQTGQSIITINKSIKELHV